MLRDPEYQPEEWEEPIYANSHRLARKECRKRAKEYTRQNREPVELKDTKRASKATKNRFLCIFRS